MAFATQEVFRFAPSPNGFLHLGHAFSALLNLRLAKECGGRFLLRVEDIDTTRARPAFEAAIYEDLAWLGLGWEAPVRRQSEHFGDYVRALEKLDMLGVLYACDCRRSDIARFVADHPEWPRDPDGAPHYPGTCRAKAHRPARDVLAQGGVALRLDLAKAVDLAGAGITWREKGEPSLQAAPENVAHFLDGRDTIVAADPAQWGDVVLARKDTPASYHIAVVVDDALQGVTEVVRGQDLYHATGLHRLLQRLLDLPEPTYRHHSLILDEEHKKLSKSVASKALRSLRAEGVTRADIRRLLGI